MQDFNSFFTMSFHNISITYQKLENYCTIFIFLNFRTVCNKCYPEYDFLSNSVFKRNRIVIHIMQLLSLLIEFNAKYVFFHFKVHLVSEHVWCEDYLVRSVYLKNTRTGETRTVTQFHFRSWPAHGVPSSTKALLEFRRKVNKSYRGRSCPIGKIKGFSIPFPVQN